MAEISPQVLAPQGVGKSERVAVAGETIPAPAKHFREGGKDAEK